LNRRPVEDRAVALNVGFPDVLGFPRLRRKSDVIRCIGPRLDRDVGARGIGERPALPARASSLKKWQQKAWSPEE
jgi:hypothetical protein